MLALANILIGLGQALRAFLWAYMWIIIVRAAMTWVNADPWNPIVRFLALAVDPPRNALRRLLPTSLRYLPIDIAFLVLLGLVIFAQYAVVQTLLDYGTSLRLRQGL